MAVKKRWIKVNTEFKGLHHWPECPIDDVNFLREEHRHTFKIEVKVAVDHNDREIEFLMFLYHVNEAISELYFSGGRAIVPAELGRRSCEDIAEDIYNSLSIDYEYHRDMIISVSEDGEVAAEIEFEYYLQREK